MGGPKGVETKAPIMAGISQFAPTGAVLRAIARGVAVVGVGLMLTAAFGICSIWLVGIALILLMIANGTLIANATYTETEEMPQWERTQPLAGENAQGPNKFDMKTCVQGFAMLPVTVTAVVSLATYKADADLDAMGDEFNLTKVKPDSVALLDFLHYRHVLSHPSTGMDSAVHFHHQFLVGVIWTSVLYLIVLGLHAIFTSTAPVDDDSKARSMRHYARILFGVMVTLLVFAAVGFWPLILGSVAFFLNFVACCLLFASAAGLCGNAATPRTLLQVHVSMPVAIACTYCFGTLLYDHLALTVGNKNARDISLHYAGFGQALFAAVWLAGSFAIRDGF